MHSSAKIELKRRSDAEPQFDQHVFAEVIIPGTPNVFGDLWGKEAIRRAAYMFMEQGFGIDIDHDNTDISEDVRIIESFIARAGDPDFIEGSWVVGMHIINPGIWQQVLDGEINGYSYEAMLHFTPAKLKINDDGFRYGVTEPDPIDGHIHEFWVQLNPVDNRPKLGGTTMVDGHSHQIEKSTITEPDESGRVHRYNLVEGVDGK